MTSFDQKCWILISMWLVNEGVSVDYKHLSGSNISTTSGSNSNNNNNNDNKS